MNVYEIREEYTRVLELLDTIDHMKQSGEEGLEDFEAETLDYYNSLSLSLQEKMDSIGKVICNLESEKAAKNAEAERLSAGVKALNKRISYIKEQLIKPTLAATKDRKIVGDLFTMSLRKSESLSVTHEDVIPEEYKKHKTTITIDKVALKKAIKAGGCFAGAEIIENQSVQIK